MVPELCLASVVLDQFLASGAVTELCQLWVID
jgi:hypothetical protein